MSRTANGAERYGRHGCYDRLSSHSGTACCSDRQTVHREYAHESAMALSLQSVTEIRRGPRTFAVSDGWNGFRQLGKKATVRSAIGSEEISVGASSRLDETEDQLLHVENRILRAREVCGRPRVYPARIEPTGGLVPTAEVSSANGKTAGTSETGSRLGGFYQQTRRRWEFESYRLSACGGQPA